MGFAKRFSRRVKHNPKREEVVITSRKSSDGPNDSGTTAYGLLIIACDPQEDVGLNNQVKTQPEKAVYSPKAMTSFTFQTTLIKVPKANPIELPTVRFVPKMLNITDGSAYRYRSETRKEISDLVSKEKVPSKSSFSTRLNEVTYEYVTIYQLLDPTKHGAKGKDELSAMLEK